MPVGFALCCQDLWYLQRDAKVKHHRLQTVTRNTEKNIHFDSTFRHQWWHVMISRFHILGTHAQTPFQFSAVITITHWSGCFKHIHSGLSLSAESHGCLLGTAQKWCQLLNSKPLISSNSHQLVDTENDLSGNKHWPLKRSWPSLVSGQSWSESSTSCRPSSTVAGHLRYKRLSKSQEVQKFPSKSHYIKVKGAAISAFNSASECKHVGRFEDETPMAVLMLMVLIKSSAFWDMLKCSARKEPCHWFPKAKALVIDPRDVSSICKEYLQREGHDAWCCYCTWDGRHQMTWTNMCTNPLIVCKYPLFMGLQAPSNINVEEWC